MDVELTKLSPKGQIVIPQNIREELKIKSGTRFAVYGQGDTIIFKRIEMPSVEDFKKLTRKTSKMAKSRGITKKDVDEAVKEVRAGRG